MDYKKNRNIGRRVLDEDMPTYKLGVEAAKKALADAKVIRKKWI